MLGPLSQAEAALVDTAQVRPAALGWDLVQQKELHLVGGSMAFKEHPDVRDLSCLL